MEDVRKNLINLVALLKRCADENALAKDARLLDSVESLTDSVDSLTEIISYCESIMVWLCDVFPRLSVADQTNYGKLGLGPFDTGFYVHLQSALFAAYDIGEHVNPMLKEEMEKYRKRLPARATKVRQDKSDELGDLVKAMRDEKGMSAKQIYDELAKQGRKVSPSTVYKKLGEGNESQL